MQKRQLTFWIWVFSICIPLAVALLYIVPKNDAWQGKFTFLPLCNALLNGATALLLLFGVWAVKKGKKELHKKIMFTAVSLSVFFLVSYVLYHGTSESTRYGGEGLVKYVYYFILLTHILLSAVIVPLVLITLLRAWTGDFTRHRKIARITFPLWLYVCITGVLVYILISPYYPF